MTKRCSKDECKCLVTALDETNSIGPMERATDPASTVRTSVIASEILM